MRSEPTSLGGTHLILPESQLGEMKINHMNTRKWANPTKWDGVLLMCMYMFCFGILSKFRFNMDTTNNTLTTAKKVIKDSPYKWSPETP